MQFAGQYQCEVSWRQHWEIGLLDFAAGQREGTSSVMFVILRSRTAGTSSLHNRIRLFNAALIRSKALYTGTWLPTDISMQGDR